MTLTQAHADAMRLINAINNDQTIQCYVWESEIGRVKKIILRELKLAELYQCVEALRKANERMSFYPMTKFEQQCCLDKSTDALAALEKGKV